MLFGSRKPLTCMSRDMWFIGYVLGKERPVQLSRPMTRALGGYRATLEMGQVWDKGLSLALSCYCPALLPLRALVSSSGK